MNSNILIATDGSQPSRKAIAHGITLAKALNARITAVIVSSPLHGDMWGKQACTSQKWNSWRSPR